VLQADEHLATATAMFREMQMPDSLEASDQPRKVAHA
jgi:hypothetical protein